MGCQGLTKHNQIHSSDLPFLLGSFTTADLDGLLILKGLGKKSFLH